MTAPGGHQEPREALAQPMKDDPSRLDVLGVGAREVLSVVGHHHRRAAEGTVALARALAEAKELCGAEGWDAWLEQADITAAVAEQLLDLHRVALTAKAVADLGGVAVACNWALGLRLPRKGEVLTVTHGRWHPDQRRPVAYVWRASGGWHVSLMDPQTDAAPAYATPQPLDAEPAVWATVWQVLEHRFGEMAFGTLREDEDDTEATLTMLETRRQALLEKGGSRVH